MQNKALKLSSLIILGPYHSEKGGVVNFTRLLHKKIQSLDIKCIYFPVGKREKPLYKLFYYIYYIFDIIKYIWKELKFFPEVIILNTSLIRKALIRDTIYLGLSKLFRNKSILFIHGWNEKTFSFIASHKLLRYLFIKSVSLADCIIVLANNFKIKLIEFGISEKKINVFPIAIEYDRHNMLKRKENKNQTVNVLFMSIFYKDKGIYEILNAIPLIINNDIKSNIKFILAGEGPERTNIIKLVNKLNLSKVIEIPGYVDGDEKIEYFSNGDIFLFPSHGEGFPTVIAEAMAAGLPIIATPVGAIPEVIEDGVNGIIISKPDPQEIAEAIIFLAKNPDLRRRMGAANREKAKNYDVSLVVNQLLNVYQKIIE